MTEFAKGQLTEKIAQCAEALADLQKYQAIGSLEYLRAHPDTYYAICYRFISVIESLFDVGQHILTSLGARAETQREIPPLLVKKGVIDAELAQRYVTMYGFRNRLVHAYGTLDDAKVAEFLEKNLGDIVDILSIAKSHSH